MIRKTKLSKAVSFFSIFLLLIVFLAGCSKTGTLKNSGFEEGSKDNIKNWVLYDYHEDRNSDAMRTVFDIVPGGRSGKCLKIESTAKNDARVYQSISVKPRTLYKITVYVKTENVAEGAGANISAVDCWGTSEGVFGTNEWTEHTVYVQTVKKQKKLNLSIGIGGYSAESFGVAYFDDFSIEEVKKLPSGVEAVEFKPTAAAKQEKEKDSNIFLKTLFALALGGLVIYSVVLSLKTDKEHAAAGIPLSYEIPKKDKKDYLIIGVLTLVCAMFSFYKLGDMKAASNYWKASKTGEFIIVEFDEVQNVTQLSYSLNIPASGSYKISYMDENGEYKEVTKITQKAFFEWQRVKQKFTTKTIKIEATSPGLGVNEIGFFTTDDEGNYKLIPVKVVETSYTEVKDYGKPEYLFDEQNTVPEKPSYMNGTYFDEVYFPRTAYENINGLSVYETTHPPLGKELIALGVLIFGMNPFGWRFMGTLAGVLMVPIMYMFGLKLFKKRFYAFLSAFLLMFDFMRLAQTRLATIDSYSCLFVLLMYYFMYDYFVVKSYDLKFTKSIRPLIFAGLAFGLGAAAKWTSLYGGAGIAIVFFLAKYLEADDYVYGRAVTTDGKRETWLKKNFLPTIIACLVLFVVIPGTIYILSYIPYIGPSKGKGLLDIVIENQKYMYDYHSGLDAEHGFGSSWYTWPVMVRPIWYYKYATPDPGMWGTIVSFGNPAVWWPGLLALGYAVYTAWKKRDKFMIPIFIGYGLQYFPWILVTRVAFIYHYFTAVPFMIFGIVYAIKNLIEDKIISKKAVWVYMAIVLILFVMYYPVLTGIDVKASYVEMLKIFSTWVF